MYTISLHLDSVKQYVSYICDKENVKITEDGYDSIINLTNGDLRKAVNFNL